MRKGAFDLSDLRDQLEQMSRMGGLGGLMGMMPGIAKIKNQLASANLDEKVLKRQKAIIDSMTPRERRNPDVLKASRKKRIAAGSGTGSKRSIACSRCTDHGRHDEGDGQRQARPAGGARQPHGLRGGMPSPEQIAKLAEKMPGGIPGGLPPGFPGTPGLPPSIPGLPPKFPGGLPGLGGGKLPGLGGFPGLPGIGRRNNSDHD